MALAALPLCALVLYDIRESNYEVENVVVVGAAKPDSEERRSVSAEAN